MPPASIAAKTQAQWQSESDGFLTGTQGSASYSLNGDPAQLVTITWDNPLEGDNGYFLSAPLGYQIQFCDPNFQNCQTDQGNYGKGNNTAIYVNLTAAPSS